MREVVPCFHMTKRVGAKHHRMLSYFCRCQNFRPGKSELGEKEPRRVDQAPSLGIDSHLVQDTFVQLGQTFLASHPSAFSLHNNKAAGRLDWGGGEGGGH
jgi:hypothetical protein